MITMTPQARAIAAFTLAVLLVPGYLNRLAVAVYTLFGGDVTSDRTSQFVLSLLTVVVAVGVLWLTQTAVQGAGDGWETGLAQAARLVAMVGLVIAVLATVAVLTNGSSLFFGSFSLGT
jgi:hypothetical protein